MDEVLINASPNGAFDVFWCIERHILALVRALGSCMQKNTPNKIQLNDGIRWGEENKKRLMLSSMNINDELQKTIKCDTFWNVKKNGIILIFNLNMWNKKCNIRTS